MKLAGAFWRSISLRRTGRTRILIIRHGQSEGQLDASNYRIKGDDNISLTAWGEEQGRLTGAHLARLGAAENWKEITVHPAIGLRTRQTAAKIMEGQAAERLEDDISFKIEAPNPLLGKQKFGKFDGLLTDEERKAAFPAEFEIYQQELLKVGPFHVRPPEGESLADVQARVDLFLKEVLKTKTREDRTIAIVTHGTVGLCVVRRLMGYDEQWVLDRMDSYANCCVHEILAGGRKNYDAGIIFTPPSRQPNSFSIKGPVAAPQ